MNRHGMVMSLGAALAINSTPLVIAVEDDPSFYPPKAKRRVAPSRRAPAFVHDDSRQQRRARERADMKRLP